jgi:hypothetical protein
MKKIITFFVCFIGFSLFAQSNKIILEGKILLHDGTEIPVKDMYFVEDKAYFVDLTDMKNSLLYDVSYQKIYQKQGDEYVLIKEGESPVNEEIAKFEIAYSVEESHVIVAEAAKQLPKLDIISASNIRENGKKLTNNEIRSILNNSGNLEALSKFNRSVTKRTVGTVLMAAGVAAIGVGVIIYAAGEDKTYSTPIPNSNGNGWNSTSFTLEKNFPYGYVIVGGASLVTGLILNLVGTSSKKEAVQQYNDSLAYVSKPKFNLIANGNGIGIGLRW